MKTVGKIASMVYDLAREFHFDGWLELRLYKLGDAVGRVERGEMDGMEDFVCFSAQEFLNKAFHTARERDMKDLAKKVNSVRHQVETLRY